MRLFDIIKGKVVTEKSSNFELKNGNYVIEVSSDATKIDIKKAISEIYKVEVSSVRVLNTVEKTKQYTVEKTKQSKKGLAFRKRSSRKAYVTLKDQNSKIDFSIIK